MTKLVTFLLLSVLTACASTMLDTQGVPEFTADVLQKVRPGMAQDEIITLLEPVSIDWGVANLGGWPEHRLYFQVAEHLQYYVVMNYSNRRKEYISRSKGIIVEKTKWKHLDTNRLSVKGYPSDINLESIEDLDKLVIETANKLSQQNGGEE